MTKSKDTKRLKAEQLGMPMGTAEKHLRKDIIHELARQLGKNQCCRCGLEIEEPKDLAVVHVQDWEEDSDLFWDLTNIAFSHTACEAARSGKRQREKKQMRKIEVKVEDPHGKSLTGARHEGDLYVAGKKGSRYQIRVRNKTNQNVLVVLTVDGRNVISGEPGDHHDDGQVIGPRDSWVFKGWRTSNEEVAAFEFGNKSGSYSAQMGSPENVGIIGCAVFEEEVPEPVLMTVKGTVYLPYPVLTPNPWTIQPHTITVALDSNSDGGGTFSSSGVTISNVVHSGTAASVEVVPTSAPVSEKDGRKRTRKNTQRLGTEFGETLNSQVRTVEFNRATEDPCEVWVIRYDSFDALRERGILVRPSEKHQEAPQAFPQNERYCQPPHAKK